MSLVKYNQEIILASTSKARKFLLDNAGIKYRAVAPNFDEEIFKSDNPELQIKDLCLELAKGKAMNVTNIDENAVIIGSDQICELDGKKIDKSKDSSDAFNQLKTLQGRTHYQNNAVVLMQNGEVIHSHFTKVELSMQKLNDDQIAAYVAEDDPVGCAGSYKYEANGKFLFERIDGDYFSIIGMNIQQIISFLFKNNFIEFQI